MAGDTVAGTLAKLGARHADRVAYALPLGEQAVPLDPLVGRILDTGVVNIRKYTGYRVSFTA